MKDASNTASLPAIEPLQWIGIGLVLFGLLARAFVSHEPMPGFGFDPLVQIPPPVGMGPSASLGLDLVTLLGAGLLLSRERAAGRRVSVCVLTLALLGAVGVLLHALALRGLHLENLRLGSAWISAVFGAVALWHAARDPRVLRVCAGVLLAGAVVLCARGMIQVLVDHPRTVEQFEANAAGMLAAQGWQEGSPQAQAFERRLRQPDPTGWFGLTNVYLSMLVTCGLGLAVCLASAWKPLRAAQGREGLVILCALVIALAGCSALLVLGPLQGGSLAKGPAGALLLGIVLLLAGTWSARTRLGVWWLGLAAIALPLLAVIARGLLGDALGELSLRFRWFYLIGAARVFAENPLLGVGPEGFKSAYLLAKPALSPEQVSSPHSILADMGSILGLGGLAWSALLVASAVCLGRGVRDAVTPSEHDSPETRPTAGAAVLGVVIAACLAWTMLFEEWPIAASVPEATGVLMFESSARMVLVGLLWLAAGYGVLRWVSGAGLRLALAGSGLIVLAHSQIEMTLTTSGSGGWALALLALAATGSRSSSQVRTDSFLNQHRQPRQHAPVAFGLAGMPVLIALVLAFVGWHPVLGWERQQRAASGVLTRVTEIEQGLAAAMSGTPDNPNGPNRTEVERLFAELRTIRAEQGFHADPSVASSEEAMFKLLQTARLGSILEASPILERAAATGGDHLPSLRALVSLRLTGGSLARQMEEIATAERLLDQAIEASETTTKRWPDRTGAWNAAALAARSAWEFTGEPQWAEAARDALEQGAALDPLGLDFAWSLFELAEATGDRTAMALWAARSLEAHERLRLDPAVQLTEARLRRVRRAVAGGEADGVGGAGGE